MDFVHLQVRSGYSFMKSTNTIRKLVQRAKELDYTSLALTDELVMHGAVEFYQTCKEYGVKPIIGLTVPVIVNEQETNDLVLLAKNIHGYQNLLALSSLLQMEERALTMDVLSSYTEHCFAILPIFKSHIEASLLHNDKDALVSGINSWYEAIDKDSFYLGIEDHGLEEERRLHVALEPYMAEGKLPLVALNDVRYLHEQDALVYDCMQSIRLNKRWSQTIEDTSMKQRHLRSKEEMAVLFEDWASSSLYNAGNIAGACNVELSFHQMMLPAYPVPENGKSDDYLEQLCRKGMERRFGAPSKEVRDRLAYELQVIQSMQFSDYFLIVWDFIAYAKRNGITTGPGRGSAAGSLVAYLLGITDVDPVHYDLLFERFLNPERISMPDIDIDFADVKRDRVIQYVTDKYGADHVAQIITFGTFGARSVIRELTKVMSVDQQETNYLMRFIPQSTTQSIVEIVQQSSDLKQYIQQSQTLRTLFKIATKIEGLPRHASTHAAGVVISQSPLQRHVPLTEGHEGVPLTQYAMNDLEAIGLLKMDFLGLRNLTLIERIVKSIYEKEGTSPSFQGKEMADEKAFALLRSGRTTGVFQLESKGMRDVLEQLKPTHFEDIVAVNALYRPGPMEYIPTYIKRKHGKEAVSYPHEDLEPILKKTYGVLVYQEQIMQIANRVAGFSLGQADLLRRAVSKKELDTMNQQKQAFIEGCIQNGYAQEVAEELFQWIVRFSNYGFNRSHAVAYSVISYQLAYLKARYPAHFMSELMSSVSNDKLHGFIRETQELGIEVFPPSINNSFAKFTVENHGIRMGLSTIKGVGKNAIQSILEARKEKEFSSIFDFCRRVPLHIINRSILEALVLAGAFDETFSNRSSLLASIQQAMEQGELFSDMGGQESFFSTDIELDAHYVSAEPFDQLKKLSLEKEVMGFYVSSHPLATFREQLRQSGFLSLQNVLSSERKKRLKAAVVIQEVKTIRTKRGDPMAFLTISDERTEMDAVLFPDAFRDIRRWLSEEMLVFIEGRTEERNGNPQWIVEQMRPFQQEELQPMSHQRLFIRVSKEKKEELLAHVKAIAERFPGEVPMIIHIAETKETFQLSSQYAVEPNRDALENISMLAGKDNVVLK
ncbi:DNA polymerase III subunit alpha [Pontibacillus salicampi]|uniref:DNA polymerase III subunit alpha n=1 Tax=Pontibacillus salicampi TaxID=1449801 RepID=A0ABV6LIW7_9BACI